MHQSRLCVCYKVNYSVPLYFYLVHESLILIFFPFLFFFPPFDSVEDNGDSCCLIANII